MSGRGAPELKMPRRFRSWPLARRGWVRSEERADRLGGQLLIAVVGALAASLWVAEHQPETAQHLLRADSWQDILVASVVGGVAGVGLIRGLLWLTSLVAYPLRAWEDPDWVAHLELVGDEVYVEARCRAYPPISRGSLGHLECVVADPWGEEHRLEDRFITEQPYPGPALTARTWTLLDPKNGVYTVKVVRVDAAPSAL